MKHHLLKTETVKNFFARIDALESIIIRQLGRLLYVMEPATLKKRI